MRDQIPVYSPRWLSWFFQRLNALPVPFWVISVVILIVLAAARHWVAWERGLLPQGQVSAFLAVNPLYSLALINGWLYLDRRGQQAIRAFYSNSGRGSKQLVNKAVLDFLSLAPLPALLAVVLGAFFGYFGFQDATVVDPLVGQVWPAISLIGFVISLGFMVLFIYRVLHQITMMRRLLASTEADIFNPQPVHALSSYGAAFAVTFFIAQTLPSLPLSNFFASPGALFSLYAVSLALIVVFFVPLTEINKRMRSKKEQLLTEISNDLKGVQAKIHKAVASGKFGEVDKMRGTLSVLREEREMIQKIPTWPWQPETLRNLLTPFLIPVVVFLVTRYLGTILGFQ